MQAINQSLHSRLQSLQVCCTKAHCMQHAIFVFKCNNVQYAGRLTGKHHGVLLLALHATSTRSCRLISTTTYVRVATTQLSGCLIDCHTTAHATANTHMWLWATGAWLRHVDNAPESSNALRRRNIYVYVCVCATSCVYAIKLLPATHVRCNASADGWRW